MFHVKQKFYSYSLILGFPHYPQSYAQFNMLFKLNGLLNFVLKSKIKFVITVIFKMWITCEYGG